MYTATGRVTATSMFKPKQSRAAKESRMRAEELSWPELRMHRDVYSRQPYSLKKG